MTITTEQHDLTARLAAVAEAFGVTAPDVAPIRRWVQSPNAGHLSGLLWRAGAPELVLVHELGGSSDDWDAVALASSRPLVALDLPGHGHSSHAERVTAPSKVAPALLDAVRSLAPGVRLTVAQGYGAAVALQVSLKRPSAVGALLVVDGRRDRAALDTPQIASVGDALAALTRDRPHRAPALLRHLADETSTTTPTGFEWRYQLAEPPSDIDAWLSVERFGEPGVPITVVTGPGDPVDPLLRSIIERWPATPRVSIDADPADDLVGGAPVALADAIEQTFAALPPRPESHDIRHGGRS